MLRFEELPEVNSDRWLSLEDLEGEVWKPVVGYEKLYSVSNYGRVRREERIKSVSINGRYEICKRIILRECVSCGYWITGLKAVGMKQKTISVHILVAKAFIPNPNNKPQVDHKDNNRKNNTVLNLRWVTAFENKHNQLSEINVYYNSFIKQAIPIVLLDVFGNFIREIWGVAETARELGIANSTCSQALKRRKRFLCKGYQILYKSDYDKNKDYFIILDSVTKDYSGFVPHKKVVIVFKDGMIANVFKNHQEAGRYYNVCASQISRRCSYNANPLKAKKKFLKPDINNEFMYNLGDLKGEDKKNAIEYIKKHFNPSRALFVTREKLMPKLFL